MDRDLSKAAVQEIRQRIVAGDAVHGWNDLCALARPEHAFDLQNRYAKLLKIMPAQALEQEHVRIGLLGSSTLDHFVGPLRFWLATLGFSSEIFLGQFDTMQQTVLDPDSELYDFDPDIVWLFTGYRDVRARVEPVSAEVACAAAVAAEVHASAQLWRAIQRNCAAYVIHNNADLPPWRVFGNFEGSTTGGMADTLRRFNVELAARCPAGVTIFDLDHLSSVYGRKQWSDERYWHHSKHPFDLNATGMVAYAGARLMAAVRGRAKKCLVLDLDNTLWGGVIADDGLENIELGNGPVGEAFVAFQTYIKQLKDRGIILAVCSKNEEELAREPFEQHSDMQLTLEDIAVFRANWINKADNIQDIATTLNIGLDSLVFVDDNPAERAQVRGALPMVAVPEMPQDPADYLQALDKQHYFETISFSAEDKERGQMYRANAQRATLQQSYSDLTDYLESLEMAGEVGDFDALHLPRIAQLINKSNQFHLTLRRYTENQIRDYMAGASSTCKYFKLRDRYGDNGLISVVILVHEDDTLRIDTWVMSCRVLSRTMEEFVYNEMIRLAQSLGCIRLVGEFVVGPRNKLVAQLYERLGFSRTQESETGSHWALEVTDDTPLRESFVNGAAANVAEI